MEVCFEKTFLNAAKLTNNGHTVEMSFPDNSTRIPTIRGGPLENDSYTLARIHYHWGECNRVGSETNIDRRKCSMEMHLVFYNLKFDSYSVAAESDDSKALTVFAVFVDTSRTTNFPFLKFPFWFHNSKQKPDSPFFNFAQNLNLIETTNSEMLHNFKSIPFEVLIPMSSGYYTYEGSLTTPPCSEIVTWILMKDHLQMSSDLITAFRSIMDENGNFIVHNYRDVIRSYRRPVYLQLSNAFVDSC